MTQFYIIGRARQLVSGPHQKTSRRLPVGAFVTDQSPPVPGEGEFVVAGSGGSWEIVSELPEIAEVKPRTPRKPAMTRGEFRLLFTFEERSAEAVYYEAARAAAAAGFQSAEQGIYLTMRADFDAAGEIFLDDPATVAALGFYVQIGLLTAERRDEILGA